MAFSLFYFIIYSIFLPSSLAATILLDPTNTTTAWRPTTSLQIYSFSPPLSSKYLPQYMCWNDTVSQVSITNSLLVSDWSAYAGLYFWMYNHDLSAGAGMIVALDSDTSGGDWDYYNTEIELNWVGWKYLNLPFASFKANRNPVGLNSITRLQFFTDGWNVSPSPLTQVCFNGFELGGSKNSASFLTVDFTYSLVPNVIHSPIPIIITNPSRVSQNYFISLASTLPSGFSVQFSSTPSGSLSSSLSVSFTSSSPENITIYATLQSSNAVGTSAQAWVQLTTSTERNFLLSSFFITLPVVRSSSLPAGLSRPFLFVDETMREGILASSYGTLQINSATSRLTADLSVPMQWGKWYGYFYCNDGTSLQFNNQNNTHFYCPSEGVFYTGEPYSKSWYTYKHNQVIGYMRDLALGYYLTRNTTYATLAIQILVSYSIFYPALPYRDINERAGSSGGRLLSQTLDESNIIPDIAVTFDIVYDRMNTTERAMVEHNLLRSIATTISRNNAGISNWQTWHNAALAIIGYVVNEPSLVTAAVNGSSGFLYQLKNGISDDGLWWENSISYHFYTLDAMQWLLAVTARRGLDLSNVAVNRDDGRGSKTVESMWRFPIEILMPLRAGYGFPSLNDDHSEGTYISGSSENYIFANWQWGPKGKTPSEYSEAYSWVLSQSSSYSTIGMILWNAPISAGSFSPSSITLPAAGLSILSSPTVHDWLLLKHGEHGGYHGHYDKLELLLSHGLTPILKDYGTVEYTQPLHYEYFKRTLSHNTILVDGITQIEASGHNLFFGTSIPDVLVMSANSTELVTNVAAQRTVVLIPDFDGTGRSFVIDVLEGINKNSSEQHEYFSIYHSSGTFSVRSGPTLSNYSIPYTSIDPSWKYFLSAKSGNVQSSSPLRYAWEVEALTIQDGFETTRGWTPSSPHFVTSSAFVKEGNYSVHWSNTVESSQFTKVYTTNDWSEAAYISWWVYNVEANDAIISLILYSDNVTSPQIDYFSTRIYLNFVGWKFYNLSVSSFSVARQPVGWSKIQSIVISSTWAGTQYVKESTKIYLDAFHVWRSDGSLFPDISTGGGLEVISDSNAPSRQFITASAPNQPATSYHPVAATKLSGGNKLFSHLLVVPPTDSASTVKFSSTFNTAYSRYAIQYNGISTNAYLMRGSSSLQSTVQGFYMDSTSSSGKKTIYGYETNFISPLSVSDTSIGLSGSKVTGKIIAFEKNSTICALSFAIFDAPASVVCNFNISSGNVYAVGTVDGVEINSNSISVDISSDGTTAQVKYNHENLAKENEIILKIQEGIAPSSSTTTSSPSGGNDENSCAYRNSALTFITVLAGIFLFLV